MRKVARFALIFLAVFAVFYFVVIYESPILVVPLETPVVERDQRFDELLAKKDLSESEFEELLLLSYQHHKKQDPDVSKLTFKEWKDMYVRTDSESYRVIRESRK